jgi:hypothetical protein
MIPSFPLPDGSGIISATIKDHMLRNLCILSLILLASPLSAQVELSGDLGGATYQFGGDLIFRGETRSDSALGVASVTDDNSVLARVGLNLNMDFDEYFNGYIDIYTGEGDIYTATDSGIAELYLDFHNLLGDYSVRLGRMQFNLGDGRLVSSSPWLYERNAFDGLAVSDVYTEGHWTAWHSRAAAGPTNALDDSFTGFFAESAIGQDQAIEAYILRRGEGSTDLEELTFALHWAGQTSNGLEWSAFGALQDGDDGVREIWSQALALTLRKKLDYGHGIGVEFALAKGNDEGANDRKRYDPVYIDQHKFNGRADIVAFSNLIDFAVMYWLDWNERWSFHVDGHSFSRQSNHDNVYLGHGVEAVVPASTSNAIGYEFDAYCEGIISDHLSLDFGAAVFSPLASLPSDDEQLSLFLQIVFNF